MKLLANILVAAALGASMCLDAADNQILGWNNLGMHCMDSDYSVLSILPPYNTIEAQLIVGGKLITNNTAYKVTYEALADPNSSFNSTAMGKGNFYNYSAALYGASPPAEMGLAGWAMPGTSNSPQSMLFEQTNHPAPGVTVLVNWFRAEGIPISPYDDVQAKNPYPMMRLIARNNAGTAIATNDIVLPVSDEMDCRTCHASGAGAAAQPVAGWTWSTNPERDYRLNILRLHDQIEFTNHSDLYNSALAARGFNPRGLYWSVVADGKPILCAACHASEALGAPSYSNTPPLTASMHSFHGRVLDPDLHVTLDNSAHRAACYRCHPGSTTRCLRGPMGSAIASDGSTSIQCQNCHGTMSQVGATNRIGWFMEPNCQSCHSGTATSNNGQIRYTSCFESNGAVRVPVSQSFATQPNTPAPGISLYRFSSGHGGLQCEACHGSTHAEFPSTHQNDNLRNLAVQGHAGVTAECLACHTTMPATITGGPHGMHPTLQNWIEGHGDLIEFGAATRAQCRDCHGLDYTGTVLSRSQSSRLVATPENIYGTVNYWRGRQVSCYDCHDGPNSTDPSTHPPVTALNVATNTFNNKPIALVLTATGNGTLTYRIITQPAHGVVGFSNNVATYVPDAGYVGTDQFTFAACNGWTDSNLATGSIAIAAGPPGLSVAAHVPAEWPAGWPAPFSPVVALSNSSAPITYIWDFGDGSPHEHTTYAAHAYSTPGTYLWTLIAMAGPAVDSASAFITVGDPVRLSAASSGAAVSISWPLTTADAVLEKSSTLGSAAHWTHNTNDVSLGAGVLSVTEPNISGSSFYRLRKVE